MLHRDIKPENIVMDTDGYVKLTDFGISQLMKDGICRDGSGTHGYMAPEIYTRKKKHGTAADYFALGGTLSYLVTSHLPFDISKEKPRREPRDMDGLKAIKFPKFELRPKPKDESHAEMTADLKDFLEKLCKFDPEERIKTSKECRDHPWFKGVDFDGIAKKTVTPEFMPDTTKANCDLNMEEVDVSLSSRIDAGKARADGRGNGRCLVLHSGGKMLVLLLVGSSYFVYLTLHVHLLLPLPPLPPVGLPTIRTFSLAESARTR